MRHIEIVTCRWLSPEWYGLLKQGYTTACHDTEEPLVAIMWRGSAARDMIRNVPIDQWPQQWRKRHV